MRKLKDGGNLLRLQITNLKKYKTYRSFTPVLSKRTANDPQIINISFSQPEKQLFVVSHRQPFYDLPVIVAQNLSELSLIKV